MFDLLVHADWSSNHQKRWMATAKSHGGGWQVDAPRPVPPESELLEDLAASGSEQGPPGPAGSQGPEGPQGPAGPQ